MFITARVGELTDGFGFREITTSNTAKAPPEIYPGSWSGKWELGLGSEVDCMVLIKTVGKKESKWLQKMNVSKEQ